MKNLLTWTFAAGCLATQPLLAQRGDPVNSLPRAKSVFALADADKDGKLSFDELQKQRLGIQRADFDAMDADKTGSWSSDEFLVYYRRLLLNSNQRPGADLEAEVTRVQALRKAKEAETKRAVREQPKSEAPASKDTKPAVPPAGTPTAALDVETRLQNALDELEKKAALRQASREDFNRVRDVWTERARMAEAQDPAVAADLKSKFEAAMVGLETQAKQGNYSREEFNALRDQLVKRGREAANGTSAPVPASSDADVESRLQNALDDLARKADARQATREDFNRVRDAWTARAKAASVGADPATLAQQNTLAQRFQQAMDDLEKNALAGNWSREQFDAVRQSYINRARAASTPNAPAPAPADAAPIEKRFDEALDTLETRALASGATREDFQRVKDMVAARARESVKAADGTSPADPNDPRIAALTTKLNAAIDQLEQQAKAGKITREDFVALRQMFINRARGAANDGKPAPAPAPVPEQPKGPANGRRSEKEKQPDPPKSEPPKSDPPKSDPPKTDDAAKGREKPPH